MSSRLVLSPGGRRYGRRKPLPLPPSRMMSRDLPESLPLVVDLRKFDGPIKDQGQEGSCTGHAGAESGETIFRMYPQWLPAGSAPPVFSAQWFYEHELILDGSFPSDDGSTGETLCHVATQFGFCPQEFDPYIAGEITEPTADQDAAARPYLMGAYHGLLGSTTALSVIGDPVPYPVQVGFTVYESFESDAVAVSGIYNPQPGENVVGGHEVKTSGYDIGATPTIRPAGCPPAVLIQNSWGASWGLQGYFWMPLGVLDRDDTDLKIIHPGRPW